MRDWFVFVPQQAWQRREEIGVVYDDLVLYGAYGCDDLAGVLEFAERLLSKRDCERLERTIDQARHQRRDRAAVQAARQEHTERHVGHEPRTDGVLEAGAEGFHRLLVAEPLDVRTRRACRDVPP